MVSRTSGPVSSGRTGATLHCCRYTGGHFDHYVARYSNWQAGGLDESVFDKPPDCKPEGLEVMARRPGLDLRNELLSLLPPAYHGAISLSIRLQKCHSTAVLMLDRSSTATGLWQSGGDWT
jgi:hypothetical protein